MPLLSCGRATVDDVFTLLAASVTLDEALHKNHVNSTIFPGDEKRKTKDEDRHSDLRPSSMGLGVKR
jgi:hypothetical protein